MDELLRKSPPFFVEHAEVHGKLYGTSFAAVEAVKNQDKVRACERAYKTSFTDGEIDR